MQKLNAILITISLLLGMFSVQVYADNTKNQEQEKEKKCDKDFYDNQCSAQARAKMNDKDFEAYQAHLVAATLERVKKWELQEKYRQAVENRARERRESIEKQEDRKRTAEILKYWGTGRAWDLPEKK
jgi:hypothetical protein